jgi:hypothetical protein
MVDKIIVTNNTSLTAKYGASKGAIDVAMQKLIHTDSGRGIQTQLVPLDDAAIMQALGVSPVLDATNGEQNKNAIDGVFHRLSPEYLLLLGAPDVIPHQQLMNPLYDPAQPDKDPDQWVPSDLPYACEAPFSTLPEDFLGPTRVVGRLPDITGGNDPKYLCDLIDVVTRWKESPASAYQPHLAFTAAVWAKSTQLSLQYIFASSTDLQDSPPLGPNWPTNLLSRRSHFINCHGAEVDFHFYGQDSKDNYPISHDATYIDGKLSEGTVVAAECCYGAELYNPKPLGQIGMANTYMAGGAYAYFGSSTIAYGPSDTNESADLLCQFFLKKTVMGASIGRATLEARQKFAQTAAPVGPVDLKTLSQFILLGDPSVQCVAESKSKILGADSPEAQRKERRNRLLAVGIELQRTLPAAKSSATVSGSAIIENAVKAIALQHGVLDPKVVSFALRNTLEANSKTLGIGETERTATFHLVLGRTVDTETKVRRLTVIEARESAGKLASVRVLFGKSDVAAEDGVAHGGLWESGA